MESVWTLILPTRPQPDTIVAIFLLKTFGAARFPSIENFQVKVDPATPTESFEELVAKHIIPLDVGGGLLDHHGTERCTSELVADFLQISGDPALAKLLAYAKRDDAFGKGTVSSDPLDRAFGLSGLIASLNKQYPGEAQKIVEIVLPLLDAHYGASHEHLIELPAEVEERKRSGEYTETQVVQGGKRFKIAFVVSDRPGMVTFLRSFQGPRADVVVQKSQLGNRVCIVTRQERKVDLSAVAALIRMKEAELRDIKLPKDSSYWSQNGKIAELQMWYVDPATNSILNVGTAADDTLIPWNEMQRLVSKGLAIKLEKTGTKPD